jgi:uncharacterized membrane protein SpoIIM required for sporulation
MTQGQSGSSFRAEREADWQRLEAILKRVENRSPKALDDDDLLALPLLYRSTLSSLSVARATVLDRALIDYLEALSLRAYLAIYGASGGIGKRIARFFIEDWPRSMRSLWAETLVAIVVLAAGTAAGFLLVQDGPEWFGAIVGEAMAGGRGPAASAETLKQVLYSTGHSGSELRFFATYLFTHNAQIALACFALGFAFGVPTLMMVFYNGAALGAMLQIYVAKGLGLPMIAWLSIHGTTELFAITLAAAAGLRIGSRVAFPGQASRLAAAKQAGRTAGIAMMGVVIMLAVAGLLEGIGRQTINSDTVRLTIGGAMLLFWLVYFYLLRLRSGT